MKLKYLAPLSESWGFFWTLTQRKEHKIRLLLCPFMGSQYVRKISWKRRQICELLAQRKRNGLKEITKHIFEKNRSLKQNKDARQSQSVEKLMDLDLGVWRED